MNLSIWSKDYQSAKEKFNERIALLKNKGFSVEHTQLDIREKGPNGDNLYIDALWIGESDCDKLYMSTSGIHGVEGFAGSAIQLSILDKLHQLPDKTALAFIHILNPWSFPMPPQQFFFLAFLTKGDNISQTQQEFGFSIL